MATLHTITGATGLVGSHLVLALLEQQARVRVIARPGSQLKYLQQRLTYYHQNPEDLLDRIEWREADLLDLPALEAALPGTDILYHCAALVSFDPAHRKALEEDNPAMTANLVNLSLHCGVKRFVHLSSVAALGRKSGQQHFDENSHWTGSKDNSSYAIGKYRAELEVWRGFEEGLSGVILNPCIILGPGRWHEGSGTIFSRLAKGFPFYSQGVNGFVDVRDVVGAALALASADKSGERYVVCAENRSYEEVFKLIAQALKKKEPWIEVKPWMRELAWPVAWLISKFTGQPAFVTRSTAKTAASKYHYHADKLKRELNFTFRPVEKTIADVAAFYRSDEERGQI